MDLRRFPSYFWFWFILRESRKKIKFPGQIFQPKAFVIWGTLSQYLRCAVAFWFCFYRRKIRAKTWTPLAYSVSIELFSEGEREREREFTHTVVLLFLWFFLSTLNGLSSPIFRIWAVSHENPNSGSVSLWQGLWQLTSSSVLLCDGRIL